MISDKRLEELVKYLTEPHVVLASIFADETKDTVSALRELQSLRGQWVSVKDRLPEHDDTILLWNGIVVFGRYESFASSREFCYAGGGKCLGVTHWRELPAAPSTEESQ